MELCTVQGRRLRALIFSVFIHHSSCPIPEIAPHSPSVSVGTTSTTIALLQYTLNNLAWFLSHCPFLRNPPVGRG